MVKTNGVRRLLAFILTLSLLLSALPAVFSEEAATDASAASDKLWQQIDQLRSRAVKRGMTGEAAFAALSDDVYALVAASETAEPGTLSANGGFIQWVDRETGIPCCYSPEHEAAIAGASSQTQTSAQEVLRSARQVRTEAAGMDCPQSLNVGLLQPYWESGSSYKDSGFLRYSPFFLQQANLLAEKTGGDLIRFSMSNVTPDTIAYTVMNCGIVIINSHGTTDYSNNDDKTSRANSSYLWLTSDCTTAAELKAFLYPEDYSVRHTGPYGTYADAYYSGGNYCINGTVIANHMTADAPNSLVYFGCCLGMATDGLFASLRERGVEAAIGFSQTVTFKGDYSYMMSITAALLNDGNLAEAMAIAKQEVGLTDPYKAKKNCYPVVASSADPYPGQGNADAPQEVASSWHLSTQQIEFSVPSTVSTIPTVFCASGDAVLLPAAGEIDGYSFAGWSAAPIDHETTAPELMLAEQALVASGDISLYAVYTFRETHIGGYVKVTSAPAVFSGDYLIVYEDGGLAFNASAETIDGKTNYIPVSIADQQIAADASANAAKVTLQRVSGKTYYSVRLPDNRYIGNLGSDAGMNINSNFSERYANYLTFNAEDQTVSIVNNTNDYMIMYNSSSRSDRFSYYSTTNNASNYHPICLYHKENNSSSTVYTTMPDTSCTHLSCTIRTTAPTCLHGGYTTKTCNACGTVWTTNRTDALDHSFDSGVVTQATNENFGYTTYTCLRPGCGYFYLTDFNGLDYQVTLNVLGVNRQVLTVNSYNGAMLPDPEDTVDGYAFAGWSEDPIASESAAAELIDDLYYPMADGTVYAVYSRSVDGVTFYSTTQCELKIYSASLILNGKIDIAFSAQLPAGYSDPRMVINGTELTDYSIDRGNYVFVYTGVNPQCIGDAFTATLYASNQGTEESVSVENYSVRQYCVNKLRDGTISDKLRRLLSDLLAYGEAAQIYTGYRTDALVTDGDDISDPMYSYVFYITGYRTRFEGKASEEARWISAGLTLTNSVAMTFRFYAEDTDGLTVTTALSGRTRTYDTFSAVSGKANTYEITLDGICAEEYADSVAASFERNGSPVGNTLYYSVNAYAQSNFDSEDYGLAYLVSALYNYGASAREYIN